MDTLADPTPLAEALGPQLDALQAVLAKLIPGNPTASAAAATTLPSYEDLIATIEASSSASASHEPADSGPAHPLVGRLHAARMNASLAYLLLDAIWILMKTRGIALPSHHPLHAELERARGYVEKVKRIGASEPGSGGGAGSAGESERGRDPVLAAQEGPQRRVDAAPAGRFIRAALASAPKGKLTKFTDDDDEDGADADAEKSGAVLPADKSAGGAQASEAKLGKRKAGNNDDDTMAVLSSSASKKSQQRDPRHKKRVADPYTEYDDDAASDDDGEEDDAEQAQDPLASASSRSKSKKKKRKRNKGKSK